MFNGLKLKIGGTLLFVILLSMVIGNFVVIVFWQKSLMKAEVAHARTILSQIASTERGDQGLRGSLSERLAASCAAIGDLCGGSYYFNGRTVNPRPDHALSGSIYDTGKTAALANNEVIRSVGSKWAVVSMGKRFLLIAEPVVIKDAGLPGSVVMVLTLDSIYRSLKKQQRVVLVYLLVNVIVLFVIGFFRMVTLVVKPVERMVEISESYQEREEMSFSSEADQGELAKLGLALNNMLKRIDGDRERLRQTIVSLEENREKLIRTQQEMVRAEKLASVGRLSAGLAHEIGNPVGIVQGYLELLEENAVDEKERSQFIKRAVAELERINRLIRRLLDFAGTGSEAAELIAITALVRDISQMISLNRDCPVIVVDSPDSAVTILGKRDGIGQVIINGILNAVDAIQAGGATAEVSGKISIIVKKEQTEHEGSWVTIQIRDNGPGMSDEVQAAVFDPFFTTKEPGKGTGLGLFVSHGIVESHGGHMWIESEVGRGTVVFIRLPEGSQEGKSREEAADHR
ncbi:MAG: hypothetical protein CSA26_05225 [Desulfobacterales bacterium]|nr:MAG: hypothetical protein CSA26_05225 [Desulfobacterales bacterium]